MFPEFLCHPHFSLSDSESSDVDVGQANNNMDCDPTFAGACSSNVPHLLTQGDLNDIVRDLNLAKKQAELLGSRLNGWKLLRQDTKLFFTMGAMKNSRFSSPRKMVSYFIIIFIDCNWVCTRWQWSLTCYICTDYVG